MNDQEHVTDLIFTEKKMSANYDTYASECVNTKLRDDFLRMLNQGHVTQSELFQKAQAGLVSGGARPRQQGPAGPDQVPEPEAPVKKPQEGRAVRGPLVIERGTVIN